MLHKCVNFWNAALDVMSLSFIISYHIIVLEEKVEFLTIILLFEALHYLLKRHSKYADKVLCITVCG